MADSLTVAAAALNTHEPLLCATVGSVAPNTATGVALYDYECVGCGSYSSNNNYTTATAINAYECNGCPQTLGVYPNATIDVERYIDIIYSVWSTDGPLTLDNATVEWVAGSIIKSTDDYSIITFSNTLVVHLNPGGFVAGTVEYTATITTSDSTDYVMTGQLIITETPLDVCFMHDVAVTERLITMVPAIQRQSVVVETVGRTSASIGCEQRSPQAKSMAEREAARRELTEREPSSIMCARTTPQIIHITERTSNDIIVAPCGKRVLKGVSKCMED